jgi:outer membrane usher protein
MVRSGWALLLWAIMLGNAAAAVFPVPVVYEGNELDLVTVQFEGNTVVAIEGGSLAESLGTQINTSVATTLRGGGMYALEDLRELGIEATFLPQTMEVQVELLENALGSSALSLEQQRQVQGQVSPVEPFALLNNFNLAAQQEFEDDTVIATADWLGSLNIGGVRGVNLTWAASANYDSLQETVDAYRGEVMAFHDIPSVPLRIAVGDVGSPASGHLAGGSIGGVSLASNYFQLQPNRRISPSTRQELIVRERAEVEIYVNGRVVQRMRLAPGRYDLTDLPLSDGNNDIEAMLFYASGEYEVQRFSQFYNAQLLDPGIFRQSLAVGYRSTFSPQFGTEYSDDLVASGSFEYGFTSWLSLGLHGQYSEFGDLYGASSVFASPLGNFSLRYSQSETPEFTGSASSVEWQYRIFGARGGTPNLRVAYDTFDNFENSPWQLREPLNGDRILASYSAYMGRNFELRLSYQEDTTRFGFERKQEEVRGVYRWRGMRFSAGARRGNIYQETDEYEAFFNIDINLFRPGSGMRYGARYDSVDEQTQLRMGKIARRAVGDFSYELGHVDGPNLSSTTGRAAYLGNRARVSGFGAYQKRNSGETSYAGGQINTAVGWAGGRFGWGRAGSGPFTVVSSHPSLREAPVLVNESRYGAEAISRPWAGALLTARPQYRDDALRVNVPDAPVGYDWGGGQYLTGPGAITGTAISVGSDAFYSVMGTLQDPAGEGISLKIARLEGEGLQMNLFTNRGGRFIAEGLRPGKYVIRMLQEPGYAYELTVPAEGESFIRVGILKPVAD